MGGKVNDVLHDPAEDPSRDGGSAPDLAGIPTAHDQGPPLQPEGPLVVTTEQGSQGVVVLRVTGELDHYTGPVLRQAADAALLDRGVGTVADLSGVQYCDSTGITVIINAHHRAEAIGTAFVIADSSPTMAELFKVLGLDQFLTCYPTVREAVAALTA